MFSNDDDGLENHTVSNTFLELILLFPRPNLETTYDRTLIGYWKSRIIILNEALKLLNITLLLLKLWRP